MDYEVAIREVEARPTAVVAATTTWPQFRTLWRDLMDEVVACLRAGGIDRGCPPVMLYHDDLPRVEVGMELRRPCPPLSGRVVASTLPAGRVATTVHRGPYADIGLAHQAVLDWCAAHGSSVAGPRWEIYGPHNDDPGQLSTEVFWLLSPDGGVATTR